MPRGTSSRPPQRRPANKVVRKDGTVVCARYSKDIADEICRRIAQGEIWFKICNTGRMPSYTLIYSWMRKYPEFAEAYAQAREMAADLRADKVLAVAEDTTPATVQADRLKVGALQWHAGKSAPRRYGARAGVRDDQDEGEARPPRLIIEVRQFEKVRREDGTLYVREIMPDDGEKAGRR